MKKKTIIIVLVSILLIPNLPFINKYIAHLLDDLRETVKILLVLIAFLKKYFLVFQKHLFEMYSFKIYLHS